MNGRGGWESWIPGGAGWSAGGAQQPWRKGGPPPWVAGLLGFAEAGQAARGAPKVRRGDVRAAVLDVLATGPMNGYQIIQQIAERTSGLWKPSPGSVYPTIQQLEDEGLVEGDTSQGRRLLRLSATGESYVAEHPDELAATWRPFDEAQVQSGTDEGPDLKPVIGQVLGAVWQVITTGTRQQQAEAAEILSDTRRRLYTILADGEPES